MHADPLFACLEVEQRLGRRTHACSHLGPTDHGNAIYIRRSIQARFQLKSLQLTIALCSLIFVPTAISAQEPPSNRSLTANSVFQQQCAKCHGTTAEGRHFGGPSLNSEKVAATSTDELRNIITNGKGRMPKYAGKLTSEEIDTLVQQVKALNKK